MGLFNRKSNREVGSNFDEEKANEILDNVDKSIDESKKVDKNIKKEINKTKEIAELLNEAKSSDDAKAIKIYEKVIAMMPENAEAYLQLANIFEKNNDNDNAVKTLKSALKYIEGSKKNEIMQRLKNLN